VALKPKSTEQVAALLRHCHDRRLAVVPQGGNTGLVGGSVPVFDEVVLSTANMTRILSVDEAAGVAVAQAGVVLEALDTKLAEHGLCVPLDLGAKGSCHIGALWHVMRVCVRIAETTRVQVATSAPTRVACACCGTAACTAACWASRWSSRTGASWTSCARCARHVCVCKSSHDVQLSTHASLLVSQDNTGYDLKQLFIGAEGTLGVVTAVSLLAPPRPLSVQVAFLALADFSAVLATTARARRELGEILSACEFLDRASLELCVARLDGARDPLPDTRGSQYMVIETSGSSAEHDRAKLEAFLGSALESGEVLDGTVAADTTQARALWRLREGVTEALVKAGAVYKYDVSMPQVRLLRALHTDNSIPHAFLSFP
jgi:D-2-hydroxyglutarate dehydrogenase